LIEVAAIAGVIILAGCAGTVRPTTLHVPAFTLVIRSQDVVDREWHARAPGSRYPVGSIRGFADSSRGEIWLSVGPMLEPDLWHEVFHLTGVLSRDHQTYNWPKP
jgi:hypothetical protein